MRQSVSQKDILGRINGVLPDLLAQTKPSIKSSNDQISVFQTKPSIKSSNDQISVFMEYI